VPVFFCMGGGVTNDEKNAVILKIENGNNNTIK
jgi:hypothetical protein